MTDAENEHISPGQPPPPPVPSSDPDLAVAAAATAAQNATVTPPDDDAPSPRFAAHSDNIFDVPPLVALQLLGAGVEALVRITGEIGPGTPPRMDADENAKVGSLGRKQARRRTREKKSLEKLRDAATMTVTAATRTPPPSRMPPTPPLANVATLQVDGVQLRTMSPNLMSLPMSPTHMDSVPAAAAAAAKPSHTVTVIGDDAQPQVQQHWAITRKFYSKVAPPISISEYLLRMHRFCPMSTGVYLATSLYLYRLAVADKAIGVTRRNAHRLLLAGLRVAMKALEDQSYPHAKMAKVGGVSEAELARLEINFCFLVGFELNVCAEALRHHWLLMKSGQAVGSLDQDGTAAVTAAAAAVMTQSLPHRPRDAS